MDIGRNVDSKVNMVLSQTNKKNNKLDIVFVETNTRCSAIVGSLFESMKKSVVDSSSNCKEIKTKQFSRCVIILW